MDCVGKSTRMPLSEGGAGEALTKEVGEGWRLRTNAERPRHRSQEKVAEEGRGGQQP